MFCIGNLLLQNFALDGFVKARPVGLTDSYLFYISMDTRQAATAVQQQLDNVSRCCQDINRWKRTFVLISQYKTCTHFEWKHLWGNKQHTNKRRYERNLICLTWSWWIICVSHWCPLRHRISHQSKRGTNTVVHPWQQSSKQTFQFILIVRSSSSRPSSSVHNDKTAVTRFHGACVCYLM